MSVIVAATEVTLRAVAHVGVIAMVFTLFLGACSSNFRECHLRYELRWPERFPPKADARIDIVSNEYAGSSTLRVEELVTSGDYSVLPGDELIFEAKRYAAVVGPRGGPHSVFVLRLPRKLKDMPWTDWETPAAVDRSGRGIWNFMGSGISKQSRDSLPGASPEIRYDLQECRVNSE